MANEETKMASMPVLSATRTPTIFGKLAEKSITFLIDTSGSMYPFMDVIKEHLLEALLARACNTKETMFNIMEFSSTIIPWADQMVKCTPQTVTLAGEWIKGLKCKMGTNTLDALLAAFGDPTCKSVYLVTDGLPDQPPEVILQHVSVAGHGRPVHCIYLTGTNMDTPAFDFLQSLAIESAGSFHLISVSQRGQVEHVKAVVKVNHTHSMQRKTEYNPTAATYVTTTEPEVPVTKLTNPPAVVEVQTSHLTDSIQGSIPTIPTTTQNPMAIIEEKEVPVKLCSVRTSLDNNPVSQVLPQKVLSRDPDIQTTVLQTHDSLVRYPNNTACETYRFQPRLLQRQVRTTTRAFAVTGGVLLQGMRVLARRDRNGFYSPGTVKEQVTINRCFLIEFDTDPNSGKSQHRLQETAVYDILPYNDAMRHPIVPGDKVLAPMDEGAYCFAPGTVLDGIEGRSSGCAADSENLIISLFNGKTVRVTTQMAVWLPLSLHERIKLETQMPISARQYLINNPRYPLNMPPGYILSPSIDPSQVETVTELHSSVGQPMFIPVYPTGIVSADFHMPSVGESAVKSADVHKLIPGTSMTKEELNRKVISQLVQHKMIESSEFNLESSQPKSSLRKSVSFKETNGELDSGISSTQLDEEEENELFKNLELNKMKDDDDNDDSDHEDDLETLKTETQNVNLHDSGIKTEPRLLFSISNRRKPRKPKTSIPEHRPMWRHFFKSSSGGGSKPEVKPFRETALQCPMQARSQPIYIDAELAFDRTPLTYLESRPTSALSVYDTDYSPYLSDQRSPSYLGPDKSQEHPAIPLSIQYDNSYRYPVDNISPHAKSINIKVQQSPMMQAEKIYYYDSQTLPVGMIHRDSMFDTIDHSTALTPDGPINRKSVFRTVNKDGIKSDRTQLEWLLHNARMKPQPPSKAETKTPHSSAHKAFATRDMMRETKETAYMEYRRMQIMKREESFNMKEETHQQLQEAKKDRIRKYAVDVRQRDIQRQKDSEEKLERTRSAKRTVSFKIAEGDKGRAERETEREQQHLNKLKSITQRRKEIEAQRERQIQETVARRRDIKAQNLMAHSAKHLEQIDEHRTQEAVRDAQMRQKEIQRREHFHKIEESNQKRKDTRIAARQNKLMDLRSQVLP